MGKGKKNPDGLMNVEGLAKEWDASEGLRERVRAGADLLHEDSGKGEDIPTVVLNKDLIAPMVVRMAAVPDKKPHPPIEPLTEEVGTFFRLSKRVPLPTWTDLRKLAWRLRYLVCFVKAKARRGEPSTEPRVHLSSVGSSQVSKTILPWSQFYDRTSVYQQTQW